MGFLAPWFLAGLAAVGLPVYIHLLRRHTTTPKPVSSLMFFERGTQSSTRHRRLRYLLLFALRAALLLLLALAFANPFVRRPAASASDHLLIVVVDHSFSMRAGTRLADAKRAAEKVLASRRLSQRAQVMALGSGSGSGLEVLTQPIQDADALRAAVESIQAGDSHSNFGELGRGMRALTETVHTPVDLHLFSDMQGSNMPANFADMVMPGNVALQLHAVTQGGIPNWSVESIQAPGQLADPKANPQQARVLAVIAGHQTPASTRMVSLVVNGKVTQTKKLDVPADGRATVVFEGLDVPYGSNRCEIRVGSDDGSADGFPSDDASVFAVKRGDPERVLFVHEASDSRSPLYFGAALASAAQASFVLQPIDAEQSADADPTKYAFVVLSDVASIPSLLENNLLRNVENGGNVLIAAGTADAHRQRIPVWGESATDSHYYGRDGSYAAVGQIDPSHPVLKDSSGWPDSKFYYASVVDPSHARVVARLADGTPLLLDKQIGQGHVLLLTSGLDNVTNDLPLHPSFVPFVDQAARYLSGMEQLTGARVVDSFVQLRSGTDSMAGTGNQQASKGASVEVIGPDGKRPLTLAEEATAQSFQLEHAGFYQIHFATGRDALIAVNPDPRESNLDQIPNDVLALWSGNAAANGNSTNGAAATSQNASAVTPAEETKVSVSLWWWVMLLLLMAAVAESILASRYMGTQREEV